MRAASRTGSRAALVTGRTLVGWPVGPGAGAAIVIVVLVGLVRAVPPPVAEAGTVVVIGSDGALFATAPTGHANETAIDAQTVTAMEADALRGGEAIVAPSDRNRGPRCPHYFSPNAIGCSSARCLPFTRKPEFRLPISRTRRALSG
jgi:hypothetical protein